MMSVKTKVIRKTDNIVIETPSYADEFTCLIQEHGGKRDVIMMNNNEIGDFLSAMKEHRSKIGR